MRITVVNQTPAHLSTTWIRQVIQAAAKLTETKDSEHSVVVTFLPDQEVRRLNKRYRKIDRVTDVLSFTYTMEGDQDASSDDFPFGELIIAPDQMQRQADRRKRPVKEELRDLLIHGYLHLLGHDHHKVGERRIMRAWEDKVKDYLTKARS
ncbi:MAG: rRNA maturation RNase YbeY [Candidatus Nomurabacteria bacterium]|nr:MAG: rRNA maturation RNase YbeY [Candidatus Nomurabacteria bacterium]